MKLEEYLKIDNNFNNSIFISKVNNMIKMIYNAITLNKLDTVIQFMSDDLYNKYKEMIDNNTNNNLKVIYDEVNVNSEIVSIDNTNDYYLINVRSEIKYLKYYVSLSNNTFISGDKDNRITKISNVVLKKKINSKDYDNTYKCLGCGSSIDINSGFKCLHCGRVYDLDEFDFIIYNME